MFTCVCVLFFLKKKYKQLRKALSVERGLDNSKLLPYMLSEFGRKALHLKKQKTKQNKAKKKKKIKKGKTNLNKNPNCYFQCSLDCSKCLPQISISTWEGRMGVLVQRTEGL